VEIKADDSAQSGEGRWNSIDRCNFYASAEINVFYHKIGSIDDPQNKIVEVELNRIK